MSQPAASRRRSRRDRHGRGLRSALAPSDVPLTRTRAEAFEDLVLDAVEDLEQHWTGEWADVDFAVDDVPVPAAAEAEQQIGEESDLVDDRGVALGQLFRSGLGAGRSPVIVVYRRPIEARAQDREECGDLVFAVVAELLASYLGKDIDEIGGRD
ncbi:MAG: metallopeptidase family protein [Actinomycetota bacterium]